MTTEHETPLIRAVDDDEDQLISLEALLSGEGWDVAAYTSARDFFVNDRPSRPGCLILDLRMPDVSGLEVQAEMKKRGITLPIIFLTGHGDIDTAVFAIRAGAEEFLQKPVQPDRLLTTVARSVQKDCDSREHPIDEAERKSRFGRLTTREREIIRLAAKGLLNLRSRQNSISASGLFRYTGSPHTGNLMFITPRNSPRSPCFWSGGNSAM